MKKMLLVFLVAALACTEKKPIQTTTKESAQLYTPAIAGDSVSNEQMAKFFPVVDQLFKEYAEKSHFPSVAYAIVKGNDVIFVPHGPISGHGPWTTLGVHTHGAEAVATLMARKCNGLVYPPVFTCFAGATKM